MTKEKIISLIVGIKNFIAYHDFSQRVKKVVHCNDSACATSSMMVLDSREDTSEPISITIGPDGLPTFAYSYKGILTIARCTDAGCTHAVNTNIYYGYPGGLRGGDFSIAIGVDGLPILAYYYSVDVNGVSYPELKMVHCSNQFCVPHSRPR